MRQAQIEMFQQRGSQPFYYWRLRAANGLIIADGAQAYATRSNAVRAARRARDVMRGPMPIAQR